MLQPHRFCRKHPKNEIRRSCGALWRAEFPSDREGRPANDVRMEKPLHGNRAAAFLGYGCEIYFASIAWQAVMAIIL